MDIKTLLQFSPVGVRKVRKVETSLAVEDGIIKRVTSSVDLELPASIWDTLLQDNKFSSAWDVVRSGRVARQEAKKTALQEQEKATLMKHAELFKTIMA